MAHLPSIFQAKTAPSFWCDPVPRGVCGYLASKPLDLVWEEATIVFQRARHCEDAAETPFGHSHGF